MKQSHTFTRPFYSFFVIFLSTFPLSLAGQMIGGTGPGDPSPQEVSASAINEGTVSGSVNVFTGTYDLSQTLGTVSTVSGPSFTLTMSYSSALTAGATQQEIKGVPYGDGWSLNIPRISVTVEDFQKYTSCQSADLRQAEEYAYFLPDDIRNEGQLYYFNPIYSIPGVGSGRLVYKYSLGDEHYFTPQEFDSPVEFRLKNYAWQVTTSSGDVYQFAANVSYRKAPQNRIHKTLPGYFEGGDPLLYGDYYNELLEPNAEVSEWICSSIKNTMSAERISFDYEFYGESIDLFAEFGQSCFDSYGGIHKPTTNQGYVLKQITSTLNYLVLDYEDLNGGLNDCIDDDNCIEEDFFYCKDEIFDSAEEVDASWFRYNHVAKGAGFAEDTDEFARPYDPYWHGRFGYQREEVNSLGAAFDHGWLESPLLTSDRFVEGDFYEIEVDIDNSSSNAVFFDVNIASGVNYVNGQETTHANSSFEHGNLSSPFHSEYNQSRGWSIHSTFSSPVKWFSRGAGYNDRSFKTTFMMPQLLEENGLYIQVGPANSDNDFSLNPNAYSAPGLGNLSGSLYDQASQFFPFISYYNHNGQNGLISGNDIGTELEQLNPDLGLYPTAAMPQNFGVGLPWHMMVPFYDRVIDPGIFSFNPNLTSLVPYAGGGNLIQYSKSPFWWRTTSAFMNHMDNEPTLAGSDVSLARVKIFRYSKKKMVLSSVRNYVVNGSPDETPAHGDFNVGGFLVSQTGFRYESIPVAIKNGVCGTGVGNPTYEASNKMRDVITLRQVVQLPISAENSVVYTANNADDFPTFNFEYSWLSSILGYGSSLEFNFSYPLMGGLSESLVEDLLFISKTTNPLGKETTIHYQGFEAIAGHNDGCLSYVEWNLTRKPFEQCLADDPVPACGPADIGAGPLPRQPISYARYNLVVDYVEYKDQLETVYYDYRCGEQVGRKSDHVNVAPNLLNDHNNTVPYSLQRANFAFADMTVVGPLTSLGHVVANSSDVPRIEHMHYTDYTLWGKPSVIASYDINDKELSISEFTYEKTLAFEPGYFRAGRSFSQPDYTDYHEYPDRPDILMYNSLSDYSDAMAVSSFGPNLLDFENPTVGFQAYIMKFFTFDFEDGKTGDNYFEHFDYATSNNINTISSYFVKLVEEKVTTYDYSDCSSNDSFNSYTQTTNYEYYEADYRGETNASGFDKLPEIGEELTNGKRRLYWEPSFLPSKITKGNSASLVSQTEEFFYLWDLKNSPVFYGTTDFVESLNYPGLAAVSSRGDRPKRDLVFETRTTWGNSSSSTSQSTFFVYSPDVEIAQNDAIFVNYDGPELECGAGPPDNPNDGPGNPDENGCIYWRGTQAELLPYGYFCLQEEGDFIWCPCTAGPDLGEDFEPGSSEGQTYREELRNVPVLAGILNLQATYVQTKAADFDDYDGVLVDFSSNGISEPTFLVDVLQTAYVHQQTALGQPYLVEDSKGLLTRYDYGPVYIVEWDYCFNGEVIESATSTLSPNLGLPAAITVGAAMPGEDDPDDALTTEYAYYPTKLVESIIDPNGVEISYEYDDFLRLEKSYRNGDLLQEIFYSNWDNNHGDNFLERAQKNYVRTRTYLADNHYSENTSYIDPLGRSIGEVNNAVSSPGPDGSVVVANHYYDIYGRVLASAPPAAGDTPGLTATAVNDDGMINLQPDIAPRNRAVSVAKPGEALDGGHTVDNQYCLVRENTVRDEIMDAGNNAGVGLLPGLELYIRTITIDEDGKEVISYTDAGGLTIATIAGNGITATVFQYDERGLLIRYINPLEQEVVIQRNYFGYPFQKTSPDEGVMEYSYDYEGKPLTTKDANGKLTTIRYDRFGRAITQINGGGGDIDPFENEGMPWVEVTDPRSFITNYANNTYADFAVEKIWQYNEFLPIGGTDLQNNPPGVNPPNATNALGLLAGTYSFDDSDQVIERRTYQYNADGFLKAEQVRFAQSEQGGAAKDFTIKYTAFYRTGQAKFTQVRFDMSTSGPVDYEQRVLLDGRGRVFRVLASAPERGISNQRIAQYDYDEDNLQVKNRKMYSLGSNSVFDQVDYTYDDRDRLTSMISGLFSETLMYDGTTANNSDENYNGNINATEVTYNFGSTPAGQALFSGGTTYGYQYDKLNRLVRAEASVGISNDVFAGVVGDPATLGNVNYQYDLIGNMTNIDRTVYVEGLNTIGAENLAFNLTAANNRLGSVDVSGNVAETGNFAYSFDGAGNLKEDARRGIDDLVYTRGKYTALAGGTEYLYDINDARIHKSGSENSFYLRSGGGQELAVINLDTDEPTWYVYGLDRVAKIGPEGSLCNPEKCRPDAPVDPNANISVSTMESVFNPAAEVVIEFPLTLFRVQLANDEEYYALSSELSSLPSRFNILQQILIYSLEDVLYWRNADGTGETAGITVEEFLTNRTGLPSTLILNDYNVCDELCVTDIFQCNEEITNKQNEILEEFQYGLVTGNLDISQDQHLYRIRLCGGIEYYCFESHLLNISGAYLILQDIFIEDYANSLFSLTVDGEAMAPETAENLLDYAYSPLSDVIIDDYEACTTEPVCVTTTQPCPEDFDATTFQTDLFAAYNQQLLNYSNLDYPVQLHRIHSCAGQDFYLLDDELSLLDAINYDIVQTIEITNSTSFVQMEIVGEASNSVNIFTFLQQRSEGAQMLLNGYSDCNGTNTCIAPACDEITARDQSIYLEEIYGNTSRFDEVAFPITLFRLLLCDGLAVYLTQEEVNAMPNHAYVIQQEVEIQSSTQILNFTLTSGYVDETDFAAMIDRDYVNELLYLEDYIPCDQEGLGECPPTPTVSCDDNSLLGQIDKLLLFQDNCDDVALSDYPITLYRAFLCPRSTEAFYLTLEELEQMPSVVEVTQAVTLDNAGQSFNILRHGDYETITAGLLMCRRFSGVTMVEGGGCKIEEQEAGVPRPIGNDIGTSSTNCTTSWSLQSPELLIDTDNPYAATIQANALLTGNCNTGSNAEQIISDVLTWSECTRIDFQVGLNLLPLFVAVDRSARTAGQLFGLVGEDYLRRVYPDLERDLELDLPEIRFLDEEAKMEILARILNYSLQAEQAALFGGIDVALDLPELSITCLGNQLEVCVPLPWQTVAQALRISRDGRILSQQSVDEEMELGQQKIMLNDEVINLVERAADFAVQLPLGTQLQSVPLRLNQTETDWTVGWTANPVFHFRPERARMGGSTSSSTGLAPKAGPEDPVYVFVCNGATSFTCYNGNCDDVCEDFANDAPCLPAEIAAINDLLAELDPQLEMTTVGELAFPLRVTEVEFCGGIKRLLFDDELADLNISYRTLSYRYIPEATSTLILNNQGAITVGDINDLLDLRPGNSDLSFQVGNIPQADPDNPIDPVTGEDPNQPITDVETPISYYLYDHLGNTRMLFRADGPEDMTITYAADYYPYGKILREFSACGPERFLTTQHERDAETGYDNRGARLYDAEIGRFLSVDPLAQEFGAISPYNYVLGNPINLVDPDGMAPEPPDIETTWFVGIEIRSNYIATISITYGLIADTNGNVGVYRTISGGAGPTWGVSIGVVVGSSTTNTIFDASGWGLGAGAWVSVAPLFTTFSAEANFALIQDEPDLLGAGGIGVGGTIGTPLGTGLGLGAYVDLGYTKILKSGTVDEMVDYLLGRLEKKGVSLSGEQFAAIFSEFLSGVEGIQNVREDSEEFNEEECQEECESSRN